MRGAALASVCTHSEEMLLTVFGVRQRLPVLGRIERLVRERT